MSFDSFFDAYMSGPSTWPVPVRRAYLLTLPISFPIWAVGIGVLILGAIAFALVCWAPFYAAMWAWEWLRDMWRRP